MNNALREKFARTLQPFVPEKSIPILVHWIDEYKIKVLITPPRKTIMGDYRAPDYSRGHQITVNGTLNSFAFLITFVHEVAHLVTWLNHQHRVSAHGAEWKETFKLLMKPFTEREIFPHDVDAALQRYMHDPASSQCYDVQLTKALARYNAHPTTHVEDITEGEIFIAHDGRKYLKGKKRRTRYECVSIETKQIYLFSAVAEVETINN